MWTYVLQRLLLMIPTLFGILLITFVVIQFVPGGPVEQMVAQFQGFEAGGAEGPGAAAAGGYRRNWRSCHDGVGASSSSARPPFGSR